MSLLSVSGLAVVRGGRLLLERLDLAIGPGEALLVSGPNGIGKSSLLRCLAGLLAPAAGRIEQGAPLALADDRLPLDLELPLGRALHFWSPAEAATSPAAALDQLGLAPLADIPVRLLSSGQRKRAALAMVVLSEARLWLLDEPLNGLDGEGRERLEKLLEGHLSRGGGAVVASHLPLGTTSWRQLVLGR